MTVATPGTLTIHFWHPSKPPVAGSGPLPILHEDEIPTAEFVDWMKTVRTVLGLHLKYLIISVSLASNTACSQRSIDTDAIN